MNDDPDEEEANALFEDDEWREDDLRQRWRDWRSEFGHYF